VRGYGRHLYVTDRFNHRIRKIDTGGTIQTIAFNGNNTFFDDGVSALSASSSYPGSLVVDSAGSAAGRDYHVLGNYLGHAAFRNQREH
jgi:hypothetical protein